MAAPALTRRVRPAHAMTGGLVVAALGFALLVALPVQGGLALLVGSMVVSSLGLAVVFTLSTDLVVGSAPPERAGVASAISETSSEFGGALGIAILGSVGAAVYRAMMADAVPASLGDAAAVEAARSTLGGAVALAGQLGGAAGAELLADARTALLRGLHLMAGIGVVVLLAIAALLAVVMRRSGQTRPAAADALP